MDLLRAYRTIRHLSWSQLANRPVCRGKFAAMESFPHVARSHFQKEAGRIGPFDFANPALAKAVAHVVQLQRAVHSPFADTVPAGCFTLLNRTIDFGGLDGVEWRRELGERNNRLWRMNLSYMGYLVPLVEAQGEDAVPVISSLLTSMAAQNPWASRGVFRDVWHPYSVSHRVINLVTCLALLAQKGIEVDEATRATMEDEIRLGSAFLLGNLERDLQYNHLFKNFVCLAVVAAAHARATRFAAPQLTEVAGSIAQQFLADGGHAERAPMYHLLALIDLRILRDSGALDGRNAEAVAQAIAGAEQAVNVVTHPDGDVALFNDSWLDEAPHAVELTQAAIARPSQFLRIEHPAMGYGRLAEGGDTVILDYGACGPDANPGHAHADFLSLELSVGGQRAIVDPGVPTYSEGEARNVSRSAASHNGPCLVGAEPIEFWASFRVGRRGYAHRLCLPQAAGTAIAGWHDGYAPQGMRVARAIQLCPGQGLLVVDAWFGQKGLPEQSGFIIAHPWTGDDTGGYTAATPDGLRTLSVTVLAGTAGPIRQQDYYLRFSLPEGGTHLSFLPTEIGGLRSLALWFAWGTEAEPPNHSDLLEHLSGAMAQAAGRA